MPAITLPQDLGLFLLSDPFNVPRLYNCELSTKLHNSDDSNASVVIRYQWNYGISICSPYASKVYSYPDFSLTLSLSLILNLYSSSTSSSTSLAFSDYLCIFLSLSLSLYLSIHLSIYLTPFLSSPSASSFNLFVILSISNIFRKLVSQSSVPVQLYLY